MTVRFPTLRGDPVDIGDDDAEYQKHEYGQNEIKRMIERHSRAPLTVACLVGENVDAAAAPGLDLDQGPAHTRKPSTLKVAAGSKIRSCVGMKRLNPLHDADVALRTIAERIQRGLVAGGIMRRGRRRNTVELDHDAALVQPRLVGFRRCPAREKLAACRLDRGTREL